MKWDILASGIKILQRNPDFPVIHGDRIGSPSQLRDLEYSLNRKKSQEASAGSTTLAPDYVYFSERMEAESEFLMRNGFIGRSDQCQAGEFMDGVILNISMTTYLELWKLRECTERLNPFDSTVTGRNRGRSVDVGGEPEYPDLIDIVRRIPREEVIMNVNCNCNIT
ncbi:hypothetical protein RP20_CCG001036 [Aedes albopictus]|nr:hypothetical protein RP20_CCG001036 [Aedes albopictus]